MVDRLDRFRMEQAWGWRERTGLIPFIQFHPNWRVKVIPPFAGATARFVVKPIGEAGEDIWVSVYLDMDAALGACDEPYWEVYPYEEDVFRCDMNDVDGLLEAIQKSLDEQWQEKFNSPKPQ